MILVLEKKIEGFYNGMILYCNIYTFLILNPLLEKKILLLAYKEKIHER